MNLADSRVDIPGTSNLRDLGGYPAANGRSVRPGRLYRSEALAYPGATKSHSIWDAAHADRYRALGLTAVIDLRAEHEAAITRNAWPAATGATVIPLPIAEGGEGAETNYIRLLLARTMPRFDAADMAEFYRTMLDRRATTLAKAIRAIADNSPVLVHCSAGKDRTGLLIAVLLEVLGTPREVIIADYALTGQFRPNRVQAYEQLFSDAGVAADDVRVLFETPTSAMESALQYLDEQYGSAARYLQAAGSTAADLEFLRDTLLDERRSVNSGST